MKKYSIGVFDSGFGGLSILRDISKKLPGYSYIYLGDTARVPYGNRSQKTIYRFTCQAIRFLIENDCLLIILACNTASSEALRKIQREYLPKNFPKHKVLGVIIPACETATTGNKSGKIGVIATEATVRSGAFRREILKLNPKTLDYELSTPLLVPLIESGEHNTKAADLILYNYLKPLKEKKIDTLILGCTHYSLLKNKIRKILGNEIRIVAEDQIIGSKLKKYLSNHPEIESRLIKKPEIKFYTTNMTDKFINLGSKFFGRKISASKVDLD